MNYFSLIPNSKMNHANNSGEINASTFYETTLRICISIFIEAAATTTIIALNSAITPTKKLSAYPLEEKLIKFFSFGSSLAWICKGCTRMVASAIELRHSLEELFQKQTKIKIFINLHLFPQSY